MGSQVLSALAAMSRQTAGTKAIPEPEIEIAGEPNEHTEWEVDFDIMGDDFDKFEVSVDATSPGNADWVCFMCVSALPGIEVRALQSEESNGRACKCGRAPETLYCNRAQAISA